MNYRILSCFLCLMSFSALAEITEDDLLLFGHLPQNQEYKADVVLMLNKLAVDHPSCKKRIQAATAGVSKDRSTPENPSFFVQCGDADVPEVVRFTLNDIKSMSVPKAAQNISPVDGFEICKAEATKRAAVPSSVLFSAFSVVDLGYDPKPNGNTVISSTFTATSELGVTQKFAIFCFFDGEQQLTDASVKPAN